MQKYLIHIGARVLRWIAHLGRFFIFLADLLQGMVVPNFKKRVFLEQMESVGYRSTSVILLAGASTGLVFGIQFSDLLRLYSAEALLGAAATLTTSREIAPVLGAFIVVGRSGSAMAAELAQMRINQELDAIQLLG